MAHRSRFNASYRVGYGEDAGVDVFLSHSFSDGAGQQSDCTRHFARSTASRFMLRNAECAWASTG